METRPFKPNRNTRDLSWIDRNGALASQLYPQQAREMTLRELRARVQKWKNGSAGQGYTPLEEAELAIAQTKPEGSLRFKKGLGPVARPLNREAVEFASQVPYPRGGLSLQEALRDKVGAFDIVDQRLFNAVLIGAQTKAQEEQNESPERVFEITREAITRAVKTVRDIFTDPLFTGTEPRDTDWRSLFEQLVKSAVFPSYKPTIITSVGGAESAPTYAAPANILPGLRLTQKLRDEGYDAEFIVGFASEFAIACNDADARKVRGNREATEAMYRELIKRYYPDLQETGCVQFETPEVRKLTEELPEDYIAFARECVTSPGVLGERFGSALTALPQKAINTLKEGGENAEKTLAYLLSHQLIFRDVQTTETRPFVIKVGAPSEKSFSAFQQTVTEGYMNRIRTPNAMIPNATPYVTEGSGGRWRYGQITMYYPRLGWFPPYYREAEDEPDISSAPEQEGFSGLKSRISGSIERYSALEKMLLNAEINPDDYVDFVNSFTGSSI